MSGLGREPSWPGMGGKRSFAAPTTKVSSVEKTAIRSFGYSAGFSPDRTIMVFAASVRFKFGGDLVSLNTCLITTADGSQLACEVFSGTGLLEP